MLLKICMALTCMIAICTTAMGADLLTAYTKGNNLIVSNGEEKVLTVSPMFWGPGWKYGGVGGEFSREGDAARLQYSGAIKGSETPYELDFKIAVTGKKMQLDYVISSKTGGDILLMAIGIEPGAMYAGEKAAMAVNAGEKVYADMPLSMGGFGKEVSRMVFGEGDMAMAVDFDSPQSVQTDQKAARVIVASEKLAAGSNKIGMTIEMPAALTFYADKSEVPMPDDWDKWFQWSADSNPKPDSVVGMADWIEAPAGKHGWIQMEGDKLTYKGKPFVVWGINNAFSACCPKNELADKRADFYAKYGVNAVRLHKLADNAAPRGIQSEDSVVEFDAQMLDQMDYYVAKLKEKGIYVKLSVALGWGQPLGPADKQYVPYMDEFGELKGRKAKRVDPGHGAIYWSPEMQKVKILQLTNLLNHKNPYTGLRYADDPAVFLVEMTNEESIYWFTSMKTMLQHKRFRDWAGQQFFQWLQAKYGSEEKLLQAWGDNVINSFEETQNFEEGWDKGIIFPVGNMWFFDPVNLFGSQDFRKQRLLDTMAFQYELQTRFYKDFADAIRETGYEGLMESSNWQAGQNLSHYYNLYSDYQIGLIDRHNYSGGKSMLRVPGSSIFSSGMQQVKDRPFSLSEWMRTPPTLLGVDGPAIVAAYGFGLNGWDISFPFQNSDDGEFSNQLYRQPWDVTAPHVMGLFPALARQVYRGDVKESEVLAKRNVYVPELAEGKLGFTDTVVQQHDVKSLDSDKVPARAMAVARTVVDFVDKPTPTPEFDLKKYMDGETYVSSTGELRWTPMESVERQGYFTVDTEGTKAVVGFAQGKECKLGNVTIEPQADFAAIYVTALGQDGKLDTNNRWLITTFARTMNKDMIYLHRDILQKGKGPIMLQPVAAEYTLPARATIHILDHDGRRTGKTIAAPQGKIVLDSADTKAVYYEVVFD
ncbi:MAG: hypothetical protein ACLFQ6_10825 [Candidatus Sumerlaeia bacterium]